MTLSKLAQLANVSVSVVSKAFSGREDVSDSMREHVFAVAREHGCFQQFYHVPYDKPVVAVIIPEAISEHYLRYMECLKAQMESKGYTLLLSISNFDEQMKQELVRYYTEHGKVNALVCFGAMPCVLHPNETALISVHGKPDRDFPGSNIVHRLETGVEAAVLHLKELGHNRIAFVGEPLTDGKQRLLEQLLQRHDLPVHQELFVCSRFRFDRAGEDGIEQLWKQGTPPTAVFGAYGYITRGMLEALQRKGISVPHDVSVISMDNNPHLHPTLDVSCIPSDIEQMCDCIMDRLALQLRKGSPKEMVTLSLDTRFHVGETVAESL